MAFTAQELADIAAFDRAFSALTVSQKVAFHRPNILKGCLRWRALMNTEPHGRHGIVPAKMLKWQQVRLARLRAWRTTGHEPVLH